MLSAEFTFEEVFSEQMERPWRRCERKGRVNEKKSIGLCIIRNTGSVDFLAAEASL